MNKRLMDCFVAETVVTFAVLLLLSLASRLWVFVFILLPTTFVVVFMYVKNKPEEEKPPTIVVEQPKPVLEYPTDEHALVHAAFGLIQKNISIDLKAVYPDVRWQFAAPDVLKRIQDGGVIQLHLSRAGGYRHAYVTVANLQYVGISYTRPELPGTAQPDAAAAQAQDGEGAAVKAEPEEKEIDYSLYAQHWLSEQAPYLNENTNNTIADKKPSFLIPSGYLPVSEIWDEIIRQIPAFGFKSAEKTPDGIVVALRQKGN